jgi:hypothetical protein
LLISIRPQYVHTLHKLVIKFCNGHKNLTNVQKQNFNIPKNKAQYKVVVHHPGDKFVTLTYLHGNKLSNHDSNTTFETAECLSYI